MNDQTSLVRLVVLRPDQRRTFADALTSTGQFTFVGDNIVAPRNDKAILAQLQLNTSQIMADIVAQIESLQVCVK